MKIFTSYAVRLSGHSKVFNDTVCNYRGAVDFYIAFIMEYPELFASCTYSNNAVSIAERYTVSTKQHPEVTCDFGKKFYKFPSYLRRCAIADAFGKVRSYISRYHSWEETGMKGKRPGPPHAGYCYPNLYHGNTFRRTGTYSASIKVWIRNTWDWVDVTLRKCDVDYISRNCTQRKEFSPQLQRFGKVWKLVFPFEENHNLHDKHITKQKIVAVDLGVNNACTCCVMLPDGTVVGREFLHMSAEYDCLEHRLNKIKKAQSRGSKHTPRLWASANAINRHITLETAQFITDIVKRYGADCVIFEALELNGKRRGSKKQLLRLWRSRDIQSIVGNMVHRIGARVSRVCAWNTSRLAYDGSGYVKRGKEADGIGDNYSVCQFASGKVYHCDLNASYNIGARYFVREILKSVTETQRLQLMAKVPSVCRRSTCTLSDLISLSAALAI